MSLFLVLSCVNTKKRKISRKTLENHEKNVNVIFKNFRIVESFCIQKKSCISMTIEKKTDVRLLFVLEDGIF